jgi:hypothetical protein
MRRPANPLNHGRCRCPKDTTRPGPSQETFWRKLRDMWVPIQSWHFSEITPLRPLSIKYHALHHCLFQKDCKQVCSLGIQLIVRPDLGNLFLYAPVEISTIIHKRSVRTCFIAEPLESSSSCTFVCLPDLLPTDSGRFPALT